MPVFKLRLRHRHGRNFVAYGLMICGLKSEVYSSEKWWMIPYVLVLWPKVWSLIIWNLRSEICWSEIWQLWAKLSLGTNTLGPNTSYLIKFDLNFYSKKTWCRHPFVFRCLHLTCQEALYHSHNCLYKIQSFVHFFMNIPLVEHCKCTALILWAKLKSLTLELAWKFP